MVMTNNAKVNAFITVYCQLLSLLDDIYLSGIVFEDPAHKIVAINALTRLGIDDKALHVSPFNLIGQINEWGYSKYDGI